MENLSPSSQSGDAAGAAWPTALDLDLPGLRTFLAAVEARLDGALAPPAPGTGAVLLSDASRHLCLAGGAKRLRPQFSLFCGQLLGLVGDPVERIAAAGELIHAASLLHDDVVDEGRERRGRPTANARWGNATAVLAGDWVLTQALSLLGSLAPGLLSSAVRCVAEMTGAAILEVESTGRVDLSADQWRRIAEGKTGALFSFCGQAIAVEAGRPDACAPIDALGRHLGVAFQLADDLADLVNPRLGKDRCSDLRNRRPSMPLLLAIRRLPEIQGRLAALWSWPTVDESEVQRLAQAIACPEILAESRAALEREVELAEAAGRALAGTGPSRAPSALVRAFVATLAPALGGFLA